MKCLARAWHYRRHFRSTSNKSAIALIKAAIAAIIVAESNTQASLKNSGGRWPISVRFSLMSNL